MFVVCSKCQRHVRESEPACPFCRSALEALDTPAAPKPLRVAFAIAAATAAMGCGKTSEPAAVHGAPPVERTDAAPPPTTTVTPPFAVYGAPPVERTDAAPPPTTTVTPPAPAYGLPPTVIEDAGPTATTDAGAPNRNTVRPLYGAPPTKR